MSIFVRIFEFQMGIGIEKSDKFQFVNQHVALGWCLRDGSIDVTERHIRPSKAPCFRAFRASCPSKAASRFDCKNRSVRIDQSLWSEG